jgi:hypothetical protein
MIFDREIKIVIRTKRIKHHKGCRQNPSSKILLITLTKFLPNVRLLSASIHLSTTRAAFLVRRGRPASGVYPSE